MNGFMSQRKNDYVGNYKQISLAHSRNNFFFNCCKNMKHGLLLCFFVICSCDMHVYSEVGPMIVSGTYSQVSVLQGLQLELLGLSENVDLL